MNVNTTTGEIVTRRPEVPLQVITAADVRASIGRARRSLEKAAEEIVWQVEMEAWRTLGYSSWTAMREAEYGGAAFMVPAKNRPELVARIRAAGLTQQEVADTAGVTERTVRRDENRTNVRLDDSADDIIDAEIVEDDEPDPDATTDPEPSESVITVTCPTCHGTGKVTR